MRGAAAGLPFVLALALGLGAGAAQGAERDRGGFLSAIDGQSMDQPIDVEAARLEGTRERAVFTGNVRVTQGDMVLTAERLTAEIDPSGGSKGFKRLVATGSVRITQGERIGAGDRAVLDQGARQLVLTGHVRLIQGENVLTGQELVVFLDEERMELRAGDGGRVHARLDPETLRNSGPRPGEARDLNALGADEIVRLLQCSAEEAQAIVANRKAQGPFRTPDDLARVAAARPETVANLRRAVAGGRVTLGAGDDGRD